MKIPGTSWSMALGVVLAASLVGSASAQNGNPADSLGMLAGPAARPITLADALALARKNSPQAVQAEGQVRTSRASVRSSYGAFLPSLSLSAGATRQFSNDRTRIENGQVVTLPSVPWSYNAGLGAQLELFDGGRRLFELRQTKAGATAAEANQVSQRYHVDLSVKQSFYDVLAARESEVAARAQLEQAEQQRHTAVLKVRAGSATKSDSLRSEIQLSNARLAVLQAMNDIQGANASLTRAVGVAELVTASEQEVPVPSPISLDDVALVRLAEEGPAVRQARAQLDAARAGRTAVWTDYLPSVTASWNRGGSGSGNTLGFGADDLSYAGSFRLGLSFPLFNQFGREEQVVRTSVAANNAEALLHDSRLAARENLTRSLGVLRIAEQRVQAHTASVAAAEEDLRVQQRRYSVGGSTLLDVLTSQTQLNEARQALIRARYDQRIAKAQLEALVGRDL